MALAALRTAAAGGADPQQTTAQGFWGQFTACLVSAGWTLAYTYAAGSAWAQSTGYALHDIVSANGNLYQAIQAGTSAAVGTGPSSNGQSIADNTVIWRFLSSATADNRVYSSNGESGNEVLWLSVNWTSTNFNFYFYQYFDTATGVGYNKVGPSQSSVTQFTFTAGNSHDYVIVADKDGFAAVTRNVTTNAKNLIVGGNVRRSHTVNPNFFVSNGAVTVGAQKTFNFSSGDPIAAGYKVGDPIMVVSQQTTGPALEIIPVYSAYITALTTSSITVDYAEEATDAGALVGADPMPFHYFNPTIGSDPGVNAVILYTGNTFIKWKTSGPTNIFQLATARAGFGCDAPGKNLAGTTPGPTVDPNRRTERVHITELTVYQGNAWSPEANEARGTTKHFYFNPRTSDAAWAIGRTNKEVTNYDFVTFPISFPSSGARFVIGPIAISGSSNYTVQWDLNGSDYFVEGEVYEAGLLPAGDRLSSTASSMSPVGDVVPFDSPDPISPAGGGSGFNSGFN